MLTFLRIQNLILLEEGSFHPDPRLNILTGETGSGKSALLLSLKLLRGDKSSLEWISQSKESASVEAHFSSGLVLRRVLERSGKNRCFLNGSPVSLSLLREVAQPLFEIVDQGSFWTLQQEPTQRELLDRFAKSEALAEECAALWKTLVSLEGEEKKLRLLSFDKERRREWVEKDLALLEEAEWDEKEEADLEEEHLQLAQREKILSLLSPLFGEEALGARLFQTRRTLEKGASLSPKLLPFSESFSALCLQLEDVLSSLERHLESLDASPARLDEVERRLSKIAACKKRFGGSREVLEEKKRALEEELDTLLHLEERLEDLEQKIFSAKEAFENGALLLAEKRREGASRLSREIVRLLAELGLPQAKMEIALEPKTGSENGKDRIEFLFSANPDHPPKPLSQCASGGEISRILLALKLALPRPLTQSCLVFDEIDSNVGGQSAVLLGQKLQELSHMQQIFCITHFVQVARCASLHLLVAKKQQEGRTLTTLTPLFGKAKEAEYARMTGAVL